MLQETARNFMRNPARNHARSHYHGQSTTAKRMRIKLDHGFAQQAT
jgi:hypothetical protein